MSWNYDHPTYGPLKVQGPRQAAETTGPHESRSGPGEPNSIFVGMLGAFEGRLQKWERKESCKKLIEIARVIAARTGTTNVTVDIMFNDSEGFKALCAAPSLTLMRRTLVTCERSRRGDSIPVRGDQERDGSQVGPEIRETGRVRRAAERAFLE